MTNHLRGIVIGVGFLLVAVLRFADTGRKKRAVRRRKRKPVPEKGE